MLSGVGGFTLFSLLCGLATSLETLVLYRIGQGACGALIMPMGQAIVLAAFPQKLHATVMVIWGFGRVVGPVVGRVIGSAPIRLPRTAKLTMPARLPNLPPSVRGDRLVRCGCVPGQLRSDPR
jgi:MFS family permease